MHDKNLNGQEQTQQNRQSRKEKGSWKKKKRGRERMASFKPPVS
jgi:hypothetical protein